VCVLRGDGLSSDDTNGDEVMVLKPLDRRPPVEDPGDLGEGACPRSIPSTLCVNATQELV